MAVADSVPSPQSQDARCKMTHITKLNIVPSLDSDENISEVVGDLPDYCSSTFENFRDNHWHGEFVVTCPVAPKLAEGDFVDDLSVYFPVLLRLKEFYNASYTMQIAVGDPAQEFFDLQSHSVAMLAALGADIHITTSTEPVA